jgi:carboxylate-amine ligase
VAGELIASEIEIRSGRTDSLAEAMDRQREHRARLFAIADARGLGLAATGTHPWANYLDQRIIDTPHYQRLKRDLGYVVQRNNTWSLHVHMGVRGADRAIAVCDSLRGVLPTLLAVSANSPFLDRHDTGLHSVRTEIFTRVFPRCGIHERFGDWRTYADFVERLVRTNSIVESTQLWWSVRPHHVFGTVEVRICDAQTRGEESFGLAALIAACIAQAALDHDDGRLPELLPQREIEENLWRAIRYGMDGKLIDFARGEEVEAVAELERLLEWTEPARDTLGLDTTLPDLNGAQRARRAYEGGEQIESIYARAVAETRRTYVPEGVVG